MVGGNEMIEENEMVEYLKNGGKFLRVEYIDVIRNKIGTIRIATNKEDYFICGKTYKFYFDIDLTNEIKDNLLIKYIKQRMSDFIKNKEKELYTEKKILESIK